MKSQRSKKLTAVLRARVTPIEKQLLTECAEEAGATLSQWTRKILLEAVGSWKARPQIVSLDKPERAGK